VAQVAQRGCRVSILGDIQKPFGYGPRQPALTNRQTAISDKQFAVPHLDLLQVELRTKHSLIAGAVLRAQRGHKFTAIKASPLFHQ